MKKYQEYNEEEIPPFQTIAEEHWKSLRASQHKEEGK